jgi:hypothetical protein
MTIYITSVASKSFIKDLKLNGIPFVKLTTNCCKLVMEETPKTKMAIRMAIERFGIGSIKIVN